MTPRRAIPDTVVADTKEIISTIFRAMNTKHDDREFANIPRWVNVFPYVNGGLFARSTDASTERLEKLFELYTKMAATASAKSRKGSAA